MLAPIVRSIAVFFVAVALVPAGAHLLELPRKMQLSADNYLTVQALYRGWALFGIVIFAALAATLVLAIIERYSWASFVPALIAFLCIVATQIIFWVFTFPVNRITANWTILPQNWQHLRIQWEYSHAASCIFNIIALIAVIWSAAARH